MANNWNVLPKIGMMTDGENLECSAKKWNDGWHVMMERLMTKFSH